MKKRNHRADYRTTCGGPLAWIGAAGFSVMLMVGCGSTPDDQNNEDTAARLKRLETRLAAIELDADAVDAQEKRLDLFMAEIERRQAELTLSVAKLEEQLRAVTPKTVQKPQADVAPAAAVVKKETTPAPAASPTAAGQPVYHQVLKGDTVYSIARQYNLEPAELKKLNNLGSDTIVPGQRLRVK